MNSSKNIKTKAGSYSADKILEVKEVSDAAYNDLLPLYELVKNSADSASKNTHYDKLNEWSNTIYSFIDIMLKKYGFVNAQQNQNPNAEMWFRVYKMLSNITYSPYLKSEVSSHHSSAYDRNEALKCELEYIISEKKLITIKQSKEELYDCILNLMALVDTPIGRRTLESDFANEARSIGRKIIDENNK